MHTRLVKVLALIIFVISFLALSCSGSELAKVSFQSTSKLITPFAKTVCVYYETALFLPDGSIINLNHSQAQFYFIKDKEKIMLQVPPARLSLKPTFEKAYRRSQLPKEIQKLIVRESATCNVPSIYTIKEWCLLPKKGYWIGTIKETFHLPGPNVDYEEKSYNAFLIMDYKYNSKERDKYLTPRSNWIGG